MPQALIDPSTSPEEILALPNVAIISDEVESLDELVNSLMRYLKLPVLRICIRFVISGLGSSYNRKTAVMKNSAQMRNP